jgi:hypothetical protein
MFVSVANDDTFHKVGIAGLGDPGGGAFFSSLTCERVYFGGGRGLCLADAGRTDEPIWWAQIFDETFALLQRVELKGSPSRVRVSPDGRLAAATMFESGHSYVEHGFSTKTTLVDLEHGVSLGDLEAFETRRDGQLFHADDFNFWGLTFAADSDTFYATLDTAGVSYLVKGGVRARAMTVMRGGVECPSLSPDNTRIAFKRRIGAKSLGWWQIAILNLKSMAETRIAKETRSVDDQVEWMDDDRVVYHLTGGSTAADLWSVRVDDSAEPVQIRAASYSPAIVR